MKKEKTVESINTKKDDWASELQNDNIYVDSKLVNLSELTNGMPVRNGLSKAVVSEGEIVNIVSPKYSHMANEHFFYEVEHKLIDAGIQYATRSINRGNKSFAVDYILNDESYHVNVKMGKDKIFPMMRYTNAYDGSGPCTGTFGLFRKICDNGLCIAQTKTGFKVLHRSTMIEVVMPKIDQMVKNFMDNEYYSLHKKFEVLAERPITDLNDFVRYTCTKLNLFRYEASEKNPETPSAHAKLIIDTITNEGKILDIEPNMWLGYNAFNEFLHSGGKPFQTQRAMDSKIFDTVFEMASN